MTLLVSSLCLLLASQFSISDYGAKEGEKCTAAFDAAMRACNAASGGRVVVPKGRWLSGAIHFRSNCDLHLEEGAVLEFTDDPADYPVVHTSWEGVECLNYSPLLYARDVENVAITGSGVLAPRLDRWNTWVRDANHMKATEALYHWCCTSAPVAARDLTRLPGSNFRPQLIQFNNARNVRLEGFRIHGSPFWTIHLFCCEDCVVRGLETHAHGHNNDGVDVEMSRNVLIEDCHFDQGDDGIVLKAGRNNDGWRLNRPTENVTVRRCTFKSAHALLAIGTELSGGVRNVLVEDCSVGTCINLLFVKTNRRRGGFVENVRARRLKAGRVREGGLSIKTDVLWQWAKFPDYELKYTRIDGISLEDSSCADASWAVRILGDAHLPVRNVTARNFTMRAKCRRALKVVENAENVVLENVTEGNESFNRLGLPSADDIRHSVLNEGDSTRLEELFEKAERGETISIAALGGSITEGAGSYNVTNRWSAHMMDWFARTFPKAKVVRTNAGIGATGSRLGCHRIARQIAPAKPDFVTVDFSVNDKAGERGGETMEGCVRQLLNLPSHPAVMLVSFLTERGVNVQDEHLAVARHYSLPQISVRDAVWPRIKCGDIVWRDYSADSVHPNVYGHPYAAALVTAFLERKLADWRLGRRSRSGATGILPVAHPKPLHSTTYDWGRLTMARDVKTTELKGFAHGPNRHGEKFNGVMAGTQPGDRFVFESDAATLTILHWKLRADYGRARVTVDGMPEKVLEGWFDATWGGKAHPVEIYRDRPGHHVVEIEILDEKAKDSNGHRFEICAVLEQIPPVLGYQYDASRGKIPTMETLRRIVDIIASLGYTQFQLYGENCFDYSGCTGVAWPNAITAEEMRALDAHCAARGIELVPNQNSFGHMAPWLKRYPELAELPVGQSVTLPWKTRIAGPGTTLCPTDPRSTVLLENLYDQLLPCCRSKLFNVGCDEPWELLAATNQTRSAAALAEKGVGRVYLDFLQKIHGLVARRGHRTMFWTDIVFRHPELIGDLPKDLIALDWGYEANHPFAQQTAALEKAGLDFYVCPGTSAWGSLVGRTDNMMKNVDKAIAEGLAHGMKGVMLADWGDGGHPQPFLVSLPAIVLTAHCLHGQRLSFDDLAAELDRVLGCRAGRSLLRYGNLYRLCGATLSNSTYLYRWLQKGRSFKFPSGMTDEAIRAVFAERRAAQQDRDLSGAPEWVRDDFATMDLLMDALEACSRGEYGRIRSRFEPRYRELWLKQNRHSGLDYSVKANLPE